MKKLTVSLITIYQDNRYSVELLGYNIAIIHDAKLNTEQTIPISQMYSKRKCWFDYDGEKLTLLAERELVLNDFIEFMDYFKHIDLAKYIILYYEFVHTNEIILANEEEAS